MKQDDGLQWENDARPGALPRADMRQAVGLETKDAAVSPDFQNQARIYRRTHIKKIL